MLYQHTSILWVTSYEKAQYIENSEDGFQSAFAGVFESILNVLPEPKSITKAVNAVFDSYADKDINNQVLIQPMMENML